MGYTTEVWIGMVIFFLRFFARYSVVGLGGLAWDDLFSLVAVASSIIALDGPWLILTSSFYGPMMQQWCKSSVCSYSFGLSILSNL
jgi:hypothetical protein